MQQIEKICISAERGPKSECSECKVIEDFGIEGDFHGGKSKDRQVSFLPLSILNEFKESLARAGHPILPGAFGENIIFSGIDIELISVGGIFRIGSDIEIEIMVIGKDCPSPCIIQKTVGRCIMPQYGIFGKVLKGGRIKVGDCINYCQ